MFMKNGMVDVEALAFEKYPQDWQLAERLAFINGFMTADPARVSKNPDHSRCKWGARTGVFRSLEIGDTVQVEIKDNTDWTSWRTTAAHMHLIYGCRFSISRDKKQRNMLNIHRYE